MPEDLLVGDGLKIGLKLDMKRSEKFFERHSNEGNNVLLKTNRRSAAGTRVEAVRF